jgi:hypothetical protein
MRSQQRWLPKSNSSLRNLDEQRILWEHLTKAGSDGAKNVQPQEKHIKRKIVVGVTTGDSAAGYFQEKGGGVSYFKRPLCAITKKKLSGSTELVNMNAKNF